VVTHAARLASRDGYFAPDSMLRRVGNSPLIPLLGAGPAVLYQVAHPLVAAGVAAQPGYATDLWRRWLRTVRALYLIAFGSRAEADAVGEAVRDVHERVRGTTATRLGPFPAGTGYAANDPELMLWVNATLTEVALAIYGRLVRRLTLGERERFYRDMTVVARIVGVPEPSIPQTFAEFREYLGARLGGPEITVTLPAREIAAAVLEGPLPVALRWLTPAHRLSTAAMLPSRLRAEYGLAWNPARGVALAVAASSIRAAAAPLVLAAGRIPQPA
jgi:uncharacterized protein (DUF2236 family)